MKTAFMFYCHFLIKLCCILGQYKRSLSDVKEDASVPKGAEHGEWDENSSLLILSSNDHFSILKRVLSSVQDQNFILQSISL